MILCIKRIERDGSIPNEKFTKTETITYFFLCLANIEKHLRAVLSNIAVLSVLCLIFFATIDFITFETLPLLHLGDIQEYLLAGNLVLHKLRSM